MREQAGRQRHRRLALVGRAGTFGQAVEDAALEINIGTALAATGRRRQHGARARAAVGQWRIVTTGGTAAHRKLIITLAARHKLPSIYPYRYYAVDGGLISYGPNTHDPVRRAAGYVDRILKGEKPADMPVQAPTKYELIVNLKTAKTLGLTIPQSLLATADEVIE
jgi:putative tryptophan/tyrosine transport system substrate-binding protein